MFAYVERNKMYFELLTCLLKFTEYSPDYLSALSGTLLRFFGQPLSKQLYTLYNSLNIPHSFVCYGSEHHLIGYNEMTYTCI